MAINLIAALRLQDEFSSPMRRAMGVMRRVENTFSQASSAVTRTRSATESYSRSVNTLRNQMNNFRNSMDSARNSMNNFRNNTEGGVGSLKKWAAGIMAVVGAQKLLENTIGAAAKVEMEQVSMEALFKNNQKAANQFFNYLNDQAKSSLFGQNDFLTAGKAFVPLTKNVQQLEYATKLTERLASSNPMEGMEGASFSIREALSGDMTSLQERFNLPRSSLKGIKEATTMTGKLQALDKVLSDMGYTQNYMNKVNDTAYAKWLKLKDTVTLAMQSIGSAALSKAKPAIDGLTKLLSGREFAQFKTIAGNALAGVFNGVSKAINYVVQNKDKIGPVLTSIGNGFNMIGNVAKTVGSAIINHWGAAKVVLTGFAAGFVALKAAAGVVSAFQTVIGIVKVFRSVITVARSAMLLFNSAILMNPIAWLIAGIAAAIAIGVLLYKNWDKIKAKAAELWAGIKAKWASIKKSTAETWGNIQSKIGNAMDSAKRKVANFFSPLISFINKAKAKWSSFKNALANFKMPSIHFPSLPSFGGGGGKKKSSKGHYHGIDRIPYDGYQAVLHKDERVLTAKEADAYDKMQAAQTASATPVVIDRSPAPVSISISLAKLADHIVIREEADIDKIANKLADGIKAAWEAGA